MATMRLRRVPTYRCYKPKNLGLVVLNGKQIYLGPYGTPESLAEYNRLVQEYLAGTPAPASGVVPRTGFSINELIAATGSGTSPPTMSRTAGRPASRTTPARPSGSSGRITATPRRTSSAPRR
jgi:hypothetical protein